MAVKELGIVLADTSSAGNFLRDDGVWAAGAALTLRSGASYDYLIATFTRDGVWHDLDLSSILPVGTTKFWCRVIVKADAAIKIFGFRANGKTGDSDSHYSATAVANVNYYGDLGPIGVDAGRIVEYFCTNESGFTWGIISMVVTAYI